MGNQINMNKLANSEIKLKEFSDDDQRQLDSWKERNQVRVVSFVAEMTLWNGYNY